MFFRHFNRVSSSSSPMCLVGTVLDSVDLENIFFIIEHFMDSADPDNSYYWDWSVFWTMNYPIIYFKFPLHFTTIVLAFIALLFEISQYISLLS